MKIANVVPPGYELALLRDEKYHLILAEVAKRSKLYQGYFRDASAYPGQFVILDNGAYEYGTTPCIDTLCVQAGLIRPNEIVLPDAMHGPNCAEETVDLAKRGREALQKVQGIKNTPYMAVPHGNNVDEWLWCAMELNKIPGVQTLGIAEKDAIKLTGGDRGKLIRMIVGLRKQIHLLGMMENMADVLDPWIRAHPLVRGVDGSKLVVWGLEGLSPRPNEKMPPYSGRPKGYLSGGVEMAHDTAKTIRANIAAWREFVNARP